MSRYFFFHIYSQVFPEWAPRSTCFQNLLGSRLNIYVYTFIQFEKILQHSEKVVAVSCQKYFYFFLSASVHTHCLCVFQLTEIEKNSPLAHHDRSIMSMSSLFDVCSIYLNKYVLAPSSTYGVFHPHF